MDIDKVVIALNYDLKECNSGIQVWGMTHFKVEHQML